MRPGPVLVHLSSGIMPLPISDEPGCRISVAVRFRPLNEREKELGNEVAWIVDETTVRILPQFHRTSMAPVFTFGRVSLHSHFYLVDKVFGGYFSENNFIYENTLQRMVLGAMNGVNGTCAAAM